MNDCRFFIRSHEDQNEVGQYFLKYPVSISLRYEGKIMTFSNKRKQKTHCQKICYKRNDGGQKTIPEEKLEHWEWKKTNSGTVVNIWLNISNHSSLKFLKICTMESKYNVDGIFSVYWCNNMTTNIKDGRRTDMVVRFVTWRSKILTLK